MKPQPKTTEKKYIRMNDGATIIVMAVKDGYAMAKIPRCSPFIIRIEELHDSSRFALSQ